jgi:DNA-binding XRE family transcriptional regulator
MVEKTDGSERFAAYLSRHKLSQAAMGKLLEVAQSTVGRLARAEIKPTWDLATKIESETHGDVPVAAWAKRLRKSRASKKRSTPSSCSVAVGR